MSIPKSIEIEVKGDSLEYELQGMSNFIAVRKGRVDNCEDFLNTVEKLNIYSLNDVYNYKDTFILDGWKFSLEYQEAGKEEKFINGQYLPDKIVDLLSEIELVIPEAVFFNEIDFDEWLSELEDVTDDEEVIEEVREEFDRAPTWAKKNEVLDKSIDKIVVK